HLNAIVSSHERVMVGTPPGSGPHSGEFQSERHRLIKGKEKSDIQNWPLYNPGETLPSKELQRRTYGALVPPGKTMSTTSIWDDVTVTWLKSEEMQELTVAHELYGHVYLATRGEPSGHMESLKGKGIKGASGEEFGGTVKEFIDKEVEPLAKQNLKIDGSSTGYLNNVAPKLKQFQMSISPGTFMLEPKSPL